MATCDPQTLVTQAQCLECKIPTGMEIPVLIVLLAQIAGVPLDAQELVNEAKCIECQIPQGMQLPVLIGIMCKLT
jgi:hypothetical protein